MLIKRVENPDLQLFNDAIQKNLGFKYPIYYLKKSHCYGIKKDNRFIAGFILQSEINEFRVLNQISPIDRFTVFKRIIQNNRYKNLREYTGYFIEKGNTGFIFTFLMVLVAIKNGSNFIYSFEISNHKLSKYYAPGKPVVVYRGKVKYDIENNNCETEYKTGIEQIEVCSRIGIIRILISRTIRKVLKWIKQIFQR